MTFEKTFRSVSRAASQRLGILRNPGCNYSMIDYFLGDAFGVLSCQFWSTLLQCGARLPIHTLNYWTVSVSQLGVCLSGTLHIVNLWRYYVYCTRLGVCCTMLITMRTMLYAVQETALPEPHVSVRVTRSAVIAHRYTYAPPRCRTSQSRRTFIPLSGQYISVEQSW